MLERRPALGKGLSALIPDAAGAASRRARSKSTSICCAERAAAARADG